MCNNVVKKKIRNPNIDHEVAAKLNSKQIRNRKNLNSKQKDYFNEIRIGYEFTNYEYTGRKLSVVKKIFNLPLQGAKYTSSILTQGVAVGLN